MQDTCQLYIMAFQNSTPSLVSLVNDWSSETLETFISYQQKLVKFLLVYYFQLKLRQKGKFSLNKLKLKMHMFSFA